MAKDFHRHIGKYILMPHPTNPLVMPKKLKIVGMEKKRVVLKDEETGAILIENYSTDKTKYKIIE